MVPTGVFNVVVDARPCLPSEIGAENCSNRLRTITDLEEDAQRL
jgi:hypothetical protein